MVAANESKITAERIRELFDYNPKTGEFIRRMYSKGRHPGDIINSHDITVDGEKHELSRFIWLYYYGEWPPLDLLVEHKDRNRKNNQITNLRLATHSQNNQNKVGGNQYGCKGLEFRARPRPWTVRVWHNKKRIFIGTYKTKEEAIAAYEEAATRIQGEFACLE